MSSTTRQTTTSDSVLRAVPIGSPFTFGCAARPRAGLPTDTPEYVCAPYGVKDDGVRALSRATGSRCRTGQHVGPVAPVPSGFGRGFQGRATAETDTTRRGVSMPVDLSLIHISEPTRL